MQRSQNSKKAKSNKRRQQSEFSVSKKITSNLKVTDGITAQSNALAVLPRSVSNIVPDRFYTRLRYYGSSNFTIPAAGLNVSKRWTPSAAYDVDPSLGSTATPGFAEFAAFYSQYRVTVSKITVSFANTSTTPATGVVIPLNADPGAAPGLGTLQQWTMNPYSKTVLIANSGAPIVTRSCEMSTEKIFGSKQIYFDDNFMSLTNNVPANNWYWAVGIFTNAAVGSSTIYDTNIYIDMGVEFFSRKVLSN